MKAREVFGIIVRTVGLVMFLYGMIQFLSAMVLRNFGGGQVFQSFSMIALLPLFYGAVGLLVLRCADAMVGFSYRGNDAV